MTDILDEILAFTEGYQAKRSPSQPRVTLPPEIAAPLPLGPPFAPSPRGIQDDLNTFSLLRSHPYASKNQLVPVYQHPHHSHSQQHQTSPRHDPAAAAISAAISTCIRPTSISIPSPPQSTRPPPPSSHTAPHPHSDFSTDTNSNLHHSPTKSFRPMARPRHSATYQTTTTSDLAPPTTVTTTTTTTAAATTTPMFTMPQAIHPPAKRTFTQAALLDTQQSCADKHDKRLKTEAAVVMPPSAKSILERREKAIREGRRKDAKLTDAERRILRRLRNRESAERCRLRRVQQAALLEKKIESMQVENRRLVAQADEYQKTIHRLERVIKQFSAQRGV